MKLLLNSLMIAVLGLSGVSVHAEQKNNFQTIHQTTHQSAQQDVVDLFFAAARTGNQEVINEFIKHGFPVNLKNHAGFTPLMMATYYGHQEIVTTLLNHGADRCLRDNKGNTALMGAIFKLEWSIAKQLRQVDCDANAAKTGHKTTEEFAKILGQDEKLKQLTEAYSQKTEPK